MSLRCIAAGLVFSGQLAIIGPAVAASQLLIWPIDPLLAPDDKAAELWLQNKGTQVATMQVRIVRWRQENGYERYDTQQDVVASPPILHIDGGSKQLIRLIKQQPVPAGEEKAYRIVIDEIPRPDADNTPQIGLKLQMRFSIPLFAYGQGAVINPADSHRVSIDPTRLSWRVVTQNGQPSLEIINRDRVHVRLSNVAVEQGGQSRDMAQGLLGYVLPGSTRVWPLPPGVSRPSRIIASINSSTTEQWHASTNP